MFTIWKFFLLGRSAGVEAHFKKSHLNLPIKQISMGFWSFVCGCAWCEFTITIGSDFTLIFSILISQFLILWYQWTRIFFYDSDWSFRSTWDGIVTVWHYVRNFQPPAQHQKFFDKKITTLYYHKVYNWEAVMKKSFMEENNGRGRK